MKITLVTGGDWAGLYIDDKCVNQNHSLYAVDVLDALKDAGLDVEYVSADEEWLCKRGTLPNSLKRVKKNG